MTDLELACSLKGYASIKATPVDNGHILVEVFDRGDKCLMWLDAKDALTLGAALIMFAGKL